MRRFVAPIIACVAAVLAGTAPAGPAAAQTVRGWVVDEATGQAVRGAAVALMPAHRDTVLARQFTEAGSFRLFQPDSGSYRLHVEALGYTPIIVSLDLAAGAVVTLELKLRGDAIALEPVRVVAERVEPAFMQDIRRRQAAGYGRILTREDIDDQLAASLPDVLAAVPGVRVTRYPVEGRMVPLISTRAVSAESECYASLYVNGVRHFETRLDQPGGSVDPFMLERADDVFLLSTSDIEAVEVYRSVAEIPAEYGGTTSRCGVVAIWLRSGYDPQFGPAGSPDGRLHVDGSVQRIAGRHAPSTGASLEAGFFWRRSHRLLIGVQAQAGRFTMRSATTAQLTARLDPDAYDLPAGDRPMTLVLVGPEARYRILDRDRVRGVVSARVRGGWRSFSLPHSSRGTSGFVTPGWGAGLGAGADFRLSPRFVLHAGLAHDWLRFESFATLDRPDHTTEARWRATSFRIGLGYGIGPGH